MHNKKIGYNIFDKISYDVQYGYLTTYAHFAESDKGKILKEELTKRMGISLNCGYFSYAEVPYKFALKLGVTGTLETLHDKNKEIMKKYITTLSKTPSMFGDSKLHWD